MQFLQAPFNYSALHKNPCWTAVNGNLKCLPYFQVIGMDKCGTTDLFARISRHPDVVPNAKDKETMWWSWERYGELEKGRLFHIGLSEKKVQSNLYASSRKVWSISRGSFWKSPIQFISYDSLCKKPSLFHMVLLIKSILYGSHFKSPNYFIRCLLLNFSLFHMIPFKWM